MTFRLDGAASPVLPLGTDGEWWGGEEGWSLHRPARTTVVVDGLGGCLDPMATGPYGGSRAEKEEKIARRRN
jgi:hypothetical protein